MNNINTTILILVIVLLTVIGMVLKNMMRPLDTSGYIINSYMYIFGSLLMVVLFGAIFDKYKTLEEFTATKLLAVFMLSIISLLGIITTSRENQIIKHISLVIFLLTISVSSYEIYKVANDSGVLFKVLIALAIIVLSLSFVAYTQPLTMFDGWYPYLFVGLMGLVVVQLLDIIFGGESTESRVKLYGWVTIVLFSGLLLYDTNKLRQLATVVVEQCKNKSQFSCTDYPAETLSLFLDILNMFSGLTGIMKN